MTPQASSAQLPACVTKIIRSLKAQQRMKSMAIRDRLLYNWRREVCSSFTRIIMLVEVKVPAASALGAFFFCEAITMNENSVRGGFTA
jgi:hypothetical protein